MVNWERIAELREEVGEDDLSEVISLFCEELEEVLVALPGAEQNSLRGHLHFLKGSALNIGLEEVSTLCLEEEKRIAEDPNAAPRIDALRQAFYGAKSQLEELM